MQTEKKLPLDMPDGAIRGPDVWRGCDLRDSLNWIERLTDGEIADLKRAGGQYLQSGKPLALLRREDFDLPVLSKRLRLISRELLHGRGFALMRGLPIHACSVELAATMYFGLGAHLGTPVSQNAKGHLLGHVIDLGRSVDDVNARTYQTNERQYYHADSCDIVGLLCLRKAREGGLSTIVSSVTLYNEMVARAPELVPLLFEPVCVDRRGEVPAGAKPWYSVPIFNWLGGKLTAYYVRRYIESAQRFNDVPRLTDAQIACFDLLDEIADNPDIHLSMAFEPGDMQFLHNHQIFHDRTAYVDWDEPERRRHLLRLWLCPPKGRELPPAYSQRWGRITPGDRGGIVVDGAVLKAPLLPE